MASVIALNFHIDYFVKELRNWIKSGGLQRCLQIIGAQRCKCVSFSRPVATSLDDGTVPLLGKCGKPVFTHNVSDFKQTAHTPEIT